MTTKKISEEEHLAILLAKAELDNAKLVVELRERAQAQLHERLEAQWSEKGRYTLVEVNLETGVVYLEEVPDEPQEVEPSDG